MAILTEEGNEYEVRVKRVPQGTYFKEYVKVGDREQVESTDCDRYIVAEPGQTYEIEIVLKNGFEWGVFDSVHTKLYLSGSSTFIAAKNIAKSKAKDDLTDGDAKLTIDCVNMETEDQHVGAPFTFQNLQIDDKLVNEADVLGVDPQSLGSLKIEVERFKWAEGVRLRTTNSQSGVSGAKKIDKESYKKHGISFTTSLAGPRVTTSTIMLVNHPSTSSQTLNFNVHYRTPEFLEHLNIVPYPPPLYRYPWDTLREAERMIALSDLQGLSRAEYRARTGSLTNNDDGRKEWKSWHNMIAGQRKHFFEVLQKEHKAFARGEVQKKIVDAPPRSLIVIDDDGPTIGRVEFTRSAPPNPNRRNRAQRVKQELIDLEAQSTSLESGIKTEPIDVDALRTAPTTILPAPTIKRGREDSEQLEVKHEAKRVKFEEDAPVDLSQYTEFKQEQIGDAVKVENNHQNVSAEFSQIKEFKPAELETVLESVEEEEKAVEEEAIAVKEEETEVEEEKIDIGSELEEEEIAGDEVKIEGQLEDAIQALARGTL